MWPAFGPGEAVEGTLRRSGPVTVPRYHAAVSVNLVVAADLGGLADRLGDLLDDRPPAARVAEVFSNELVAVPNIGVEAWLVSRLAARPAPAGGVAPVVAGVDLVFPSSVVSRALARHEAAAAWPTIGRLTWAVHAALVDDPDLAAVVATQPGASLLGRARSLADLFDRYLLHRPDMVREWERTGPPASPDVAHLQARLWRAVVDHLGVAVATAQQAGIAALASGELEPDVPARLSLFGVSSLPTLHREVIAALGRRRDVHLFAPTVSLAARAGVLDAGDPVGIGDSVDHRLVRSWAAGNLEDHLVLGGLADRVEVLGGPEEAPSPGDPAPLLGLVQAGLRTAEDPRRSDSGPLDPADCSIRWHRCYGPARQAEVLSDALRHLLEPSGGGADLEFRDVVILCPDVPTFAPLVQAAFAARDGVAEVPLAVTDLSLSATTPLVDVTAALLNVLDGRFRPADLLALAGRDPVARRFGFAPSDLANLAELVAAVNVAWGADPDRRAAYFGHHGDLSLDAPLGSRTWAEGLTQLAAGAALADRPIHAAADLPTIPLPRLEDPAVVAAVGAFAEFIEVVRSGADRLGEVQSPLDWVDRLVVTLDHLVEVSDDDAWQWRRLDEVLVAFADDAQGVAGSGVDGRELAGLLGGQLGGTAGRARFGSGAVTLTSLTGLRGVPHRVVVLLGIDGDLGTSGVRADDLLSLDRRPGEPQPLREVRAQLLDAVLAAQDHLLIVSTAVDPRSNKEVAPAVPLAELLAIIDDTADGPAGGPVDRPASVAISVDHPRHAWSTPNFAGGDDAVVPGQRWGFDEAALAAARLRERGVDGRVEDAAAPPHWAPLGADPGLVPATGEVTLRELSTAVRNPAEAYLRARLGVVLPEERPQVSDGLVDLRPTGLDRYHLLDELWDLIGPGSTADEAVAREATAGTPGGDDVTAQVKDAWRRAQAHRGALPPAPYLDDTFEDVDAVVSAFRAELDTLVGERPAERVSLSVRLDTGVTVTGDAVVVRDGDNSVVLDVRLARRKDADRVGGLLLLAAVVAQFPAERWRLEQLRRPQQSSRKNPVDAATVTLRADASGAQTASASSVLEWAVDYRDHALAGFFPALPSTLAAVWTALDTARDRPDGEPDLNRALSTWGESDDDASNYRSGDRTDRWVSMPGETPEFEELWLLAPTPNEDDWVASLPAAWPGADRRLGVWAERLWGSVQRFADGVSP